MATQLKYDKIEPMDTQKILILVALIIPILKATAQTEKEFYKGVEPSLIEKLCPKMITHEDSLVLYFVSVKMPDSLVNTNYVVWEKSLFKNKKLEPVALHKKEANRPVNAYCKQIWKDETQKGRVEVDIIVCQTQGDLNEVIKSYTQEKYTIQFRKTDEPIIGQQSWIPTSVEQEQQSPVVLFYVSNVFVRVASTIGVSEVNKSETLTRVLSTKIEEDILAIIKLKNWKQ